MDVKSFRELHESDGPLVLPNAWDLGSGIAFASAGFLAIGTTSFGISASAGLPDGGRSSKQPTAMLAAQLCGLPVHVTADIEEGYSDDPAEVSAFVAELVAMGVAGVNLEDSKDGHLADPAVLAAKIAAVRRESPGVFVNARVDNLWFGEDATADAVLLRARIYADAGADGIFVPGLTEAADIRTIASGIGLPLNVLAHPSLTVAQLGEFGVRRVSSGSLPYRAAVDAAVYSVVALRDGKPAVTATPYWEMQSRLVAFSRGIVG
ncbi:isocitrate lyase/phosphoenolpyruvate mutase family protein [Terrimesophilobacter mesophilus]|uniref:Isocitrate lyase/phosphoenolpyruvate mutase family protein n=1 Tax=Terrimesophilobacter mesophilus TaxID=433647 RepID=A0A4R8VDB1_9MICO|nr:isocitrate lyase/phosphoenolpyruvate mutase family protein [Terrimesophilobacter mesophilus]